MSAEGGLRTIRSFVMRGGRATTAQQRALCEQWPRYGFDYCAVPSDLDALFGRAAPRTLEIGFGNGEFLAATADRQPSRDFLGIEVHPPGVGHLLQLAAAAELTNLKVSRHDAVEVVRDQLAPMSLAEVLILFPDPWHKKRHHKRRLVNEPFASILASRLAIGGKLHLATDWEDYARQMIEVLDAQPLLRNRAGQGGFVPRDENREPTRFERRGERLGHAVFDLEYARI